MLLHSWSSTITLVIDEFVTKVLLKQQTIYDTMLQNSKNIKSLFTHPYINYKIKWHSFYLILCMNFKFFTIV